MLPAATICRTGFVFSVCLLLTACSGIELNSVNPPDVNLSGHWQLDAEASDVVPDLRNHVPNSAKARRRAARAGGGRGLGGGAGSGLTFIRHDFQVLRASKIEIEQNRDSMGVRHVPGVYRDVSWGERQRGLWEVYAGWEGDALVVISKANDLHVQERYALAATDRLAVKVSITADNEDFEFNRVFNRQP